MKRSNRASIIGTEVNGRVETIDFQAAQRKHILYKKRLKVQRIMGIAVIVVSLVGLTLEGSFIIPLVLGVALTVTRDIVFVP